ncbi:hypothetical protein SteCoe_6659 [Stentor coeruleus]|uniref:GYF domain-containing protein n=1 Tax=Stentor coeruleus TaxID=5963 RepID=A0A1R2CPG0_9CILI|nr:hypothetical protein SteCoe_6659 [Stentor coeruleus]
MSSGYHWKKSRKSRQKTGNSAKLKYSLDQILEKFQPTLPPALVAIPIELFVELSKPILPECPKILCENSRKKPRPDKKVKGKDYRIEITEAHSGDRSPRCSDILESPRFSEKIVRPVPKIGKIIEALDLETEIIEKPEIPQKKFSMFLKITQVTEEIVEVESEREKEPIEEPTEIHYEQSLIKTHVESGNPFACMISEKSILKDGQVTPVKGAFERIWRYKDPLNKIHGPYSSVEMFNWSASGYLTTRLPVSREGFTGFFSLETFMHIEKSKKSFFL